MVYGMIYVGVFLVRIQQDCRDYKPIQEFVRDLCFTFGVGTLGSAAVMVVQGLHFN